MRAIGRSAKHLILALPLRHLLRHQLLRKISAVNGEMSDVPLDILAWRRKYHNEEEPVLLEDNLPSRDPFKMFDIWFKNVASKTDLMFEEVNAVSLSTVSKDGQPSSRMVLLRSYSPEGFVFHSNYYSRKGKEIGDHGKVALLFFWPKVHRQVRIEGHAAHWTDEENDKYWMSRPVANRIGSSCSEQSEIIPDRQFLLDKKAELEKLAKEKGEQAITRPPHWGGFVIKPEYFEFWQGQSDRVHDRIIFDQDAEGGKVAENGWLIKRLSP